MRALLLLGALIAAAVGALVIWSRLDSPGPGTRAPASAGLAEEESPPASATRPEPVATPERTEAAELAPRGATPDRGAAAAEVSRTFEPPLEDGLRVRVVRAADGQPVPEATVLWISELSFTRADIEHTMAAGLNVERFFGSYGRRFRADAQGELFVPRATDDLVLAGKSADLWGLLEVEPDEMGADVLLALVLDPPLVVDVVDHLGLPAGGLKVALAIASRRGGSGDTLLRESTDASGRASIPHVGTMAAQFARDRALVVEAAILAEAPVAVPIDPASLPVEPLRLELPPLGRLDVELVDGDGEPILEPVLIRLQAPAVEASLQDVAGQGAASFPVAPGLEVQVLAELTGREPAMEVLAGPTAADEVVRVRLELSYPRPLLVGRLLDPDGQPLSDARVEHRMEQHHADGDSRARRGDFRTDLQGHFAFEPEESYAGGQRALTLMHRLDPDVPPLEVAVDLGFELAPGPNELGELTLAVPPRVAEGRVVDENGAAIAGARVRVLQEVTYERRGRTSTRWTRAPGLEAVTDRDGAFALWGHPSSRSGALAVRAEHSDCVRMERLPIAAGVVNLQIVLVGAGRVTGRVLVDDEIDFDELQVALFDERDPEGRRGRAGLGDDGRFERSGLPPGLYGLEVRCTAGGPSFGAVEGLAVTAGQTLELQPIDLRGELTAIGIEVIADDGRDLRDVIVAAREAGTDDYDLGVRSRSSERRTITTAHRALDLRIVAAGYRTEYLAGVSSDVRVVLRAGLRVRLRVAEGVPELLAGESLVLSLQSERLHEERGWKERATVDERGQVELIAPEPGEYEVHAHLAIVRADGQQSGIGFQPPASIRVRETAELQEFDIAVDRERLERGREHLLDD